MGKSCSNCGEPVGPHGARGYCPKCYQRWRRNGTPDTLIPKAAGNCSNCGGLIGPHGAKGYCANCYARWRRHGDPNVVKIVRRPGAICSECDKPAVARGYCPKHWMRWRHHGDPNFVTPRAEPDCAACGDPVGRHGAKGYCARCYQRWHRHGDPSIVLTRGGAHGGSGSGGPRKYSLNDDYFTEIDTAEKAYWLGFITADGCILTNRAGRPAYLRVELARCDEEHLRELCVDLGSDRPVLRYGDTATVSFGSRRLAQALCKLGVTPRKSLIVKPWDGPVGLMPHYWRGLFDGDGGICQSSGCWFAKISGSASCVEAFAVWARAACGSKAKAIPVRPGNECWQWQVSSNKMTQILVRALYEDAPVALGRKRLLAQELLAIDFAEMWAQANARRAATMREAWASGRHPRARKT
jgi:hypothetical protein